MSNESESISILQYLWGALILPLGWLFSRQTKIETQLEEHMDKDDTKEYVELKQKAIEVKLDHTIESLAEIKQAVVELKDEIRKQ
ncbi:coil containing protein [Vibrio phage 1.015.O._10N.222.51.E5]|nr:coil containing protein [Vibrio phage 1.015.O._10N.222.51.E5]